MDTKRIKRKKDSATDRISNLPCNVIDDILKFLPLGDAVRTSILSSQWRYKWQTIPYLIFDDEFIGGVDGKYNIETVIDQLLLHHKAPIVKFMVTFDYEVEYIFKHVVNHWLQFLSTHRIEELKLCFSCSGINPLLSHHLFTFDQLEHLSLLNCKLRPPSTFKGFGRLLTLKLQSVKLEPGEFKRFISKCPMLEHLFLDHIYFVEASGQLSIHAPNLKSFSFSFWNQFPQISVESTSFLEEVLFNFLEVSSSEMYTQNNLIEFFGQLSSIKKLILERDILKLLGRDDVLQKVPVNLSDLLLLQLYYINFFDKAGLHAAVCLIRSSPNLRTLQISSTTGKGDMKTAALYLKAQQKGELTLDHLKDVRINGFSGSEPEMEFVKLLLSAATELKELHLILIHRLEDATAEGYKMLKMLAGYPRASSEAKITFEDNSDKSITTGKSDVKTAAPFLKAQQNGELTLSHLKDVWIKGFSGLEPEMQFVKLLLSTATALDT